MTTQIHSHMYKGTFMHICTRPYTWNTCTLQKISRNLRIVSGFLLFRYTKTKVLSGRRNYLEQIVLDADDHCVSHCSDDAKSAYYIYTHVALKTLKKKKLKTEMLTEWNRPNKAGTKLGTWRYSNWLTPIDDVRCDLKHSPTKSSILLTAALKHLFLDDRTFWKFLMLCMSHFSCQCDRMSDRGNLREEGLDLAHGFQDYQSIVAGRV